MVLGPAGTKLRQQNETFPQGVRDASESDAVTTQPERSCFYPANLKSESLQFMRSGKSIVTQTLPLYVHRDARRLLLLCAHTHTSITLCKATLDWRRAQQKGLQKGTLQAKKNNRGGRVPSLAVERE